MSKNLRFAFLSVATACLVSFGASHFFSSPGWEGSFPEAGERSGTALAWIPNERVAGELDPESGAKALARLRMAFEENSGQCDEEVQYLARGKDYTLFLTAEEAVLSLAGNQTRRTVRMKPVGGNPTPTIRGEGGLPGQVNYIRGNDPNQWNTGISRYEKVCYEEVYPGIDLVFYGNGQELEYDFVVSPGADPSQISLAFEGVEATDDGPAVEVAKNGDLLLRAQEGEIRQKKPFVYQDLAGERVPVSGEYRVENDDQVGFLVAEYDPAFPLVIDPILVYSTYLGGTLKDQSPTFHLDDLRNLYVVGTTESIDFPTANAFDATLNAGIESNRDFFVTKLNPDGSSLIYSTYLGGTGMELRIRLALDSSNNVFLCGLTDSLDFPLVSPIDNTAEELEGFVAKLNSDGASLAFSTYLGGSGEENSVGIAVDNLGNAMVSGGTSSADFPTFLALDSTLSGDSDAFLTKIAGDGTSILFSTYLGGSENEGSRIVAVDASGNAYVSGTTESVDFPTVNAFDSTLNDGINDARDDFVTKISSSGDSILYSTYLGGAEEEGSIEIAVDSDGCAYLAGETNSTDFPTTLGAFQDQRNGIDFRDVFVTKLNPDGSLGYSTYLGGTKDDFDASITVDSAGNAYVAASSKSTDFPLVNPLDSVLNDGAPSDEVDDLVVAVLNGTGSTLLFSTYFGGTLDDDDPDIALDSVGNVYFGGETGSTDFPTANAFDATWNDANDPNGLDVGLAKLTGELCTAGNVNAQAGLTEEVLTINGSNGGMVHNVTVLSGTPITLGLAAGSGSPANARYLIWVWAGSGGSAIDLTAMAQSLGCTVNPTPLSVLTPQPVRCLRGLGIPAGACGAAQVVPSPDFAPFSLTRASGVVGPKSFTFQGLIEDGTATHPSGFSITNSVTLVVE